jgi:hypothetical protein
MAPRMVEIAARKTGAVPKPFVVLAKALLLKRVRGVALELYPSHAKPNLRPLLQPLPRKAQGFRELPLDGAKRRMPQGAFALTLVETRVLAFHPRIVTCGPSLIRHQRRPFPRRL